MSLLPGLRLGPYEILSPLGAGGMGEVYSSLLPGAPPPLDHVVAKCLAKDPDERWQSAADVASELRWIALTGSQAGAPMEAAPRRTVAGRVWPAVAVALAARCALLGVLAIGRARGPVANAPVLRFSVAAPEGTIFNFGSDSSAEVGGAPALSPDGSRLLYTSITKRAGTDLRIRELGGMGRDDVLVHDPRGCYVGDWSPDGRFALLTCATYAPGEKWSLQLLSVGDRKVSPWLETGSNVRDPVFSPDGRWVAYGSDESGTYEIYVRPFSGEGGKWQVSRGTGSQAKWRGDGRELFYLTADGHMMAVETRAAATGFEAGPPKQLFDPPVAKPQVFPSIPFCVSADGQRFLVITPTGASGPPPLTVVVNWPTLLKP